jgi:flavin reductase (DIM6/NTAB) family NADH-FMN oxidoreductase RutF
MTAAVQSSGAAVVDAALLKDAMSRFTTGVTVVTTHHEGHDYGMTCNSFNSVSLDPPMVLWSIRQSSQAHAAFVGSAGYVVNVLSTTQKDVAMKFTQGSHDERFHGVPARRSASNKPQLTDAVAWFECDLVQAIPVGDHTIMLGKVTACGTQAGQGLAYSQRAFGVMQAL